MLDRCELPVQLDNEKCRRDRDTRHFSNSSRLDLPSLCNSNYARLTTTHTTRGCAGDTHQTQLGNSQHQHQHQHQRQLSPVHTTNGNSITATANLGSHNSNSKNISNKANNSNSNSNNNTNSNSNSNTNNKINNSSSNNNMIGSPVSSTTASSHGNSSSGERGSTKSSSASSGDGEVKCNTPMTPTELIKKYRNFLTDLEFEELKIYKEIWYFGQNASKNYNKSTSTNTTSNSGYDDDNGNYKIIIHDHIGFRYEILEVIGKGSFGQVIRALDHKTNTHVAIKIIRNKKRFLNQAVVELNILDELREKDADGSHNVIHMLDYTYFRKHLCITFELMSLNLYELIKKNNYNGFSMSLIRRFCNSIVKCLRLLYNENIIHCDLKPENILLKQRGSSSIKVIDFGSSCYANRKIYTYIQSRFYRSPEVILGLQYGPAIDMWSLGCILAELYTGFPLFPGGNEVEQLACIMEVIGLPPKKLIANATRRRLFFDSQGAPRCVTYSKGRKRTPGSKTLSQLLLCQDRYFINFLQRCLEWDPAERMTPDEAAYHEFLQQSASSRHRSCRMSNSSSSSGLNSSSQKSSCYNFADISPITAVVQGGAGGGGLSGKSGGAVVASITSTTAVSNAAITATTMTQNSIHNSSTSSNRNINSMTSSLMSSSLISNINSSNINSNTINSSSSNIINGNNTTISGNGSGTSNNNSIKTSHRYTMSSHHHHHASSSNILPDIKFQPDKYGSMQKPAVRHNITSSVSDLEYRIYGHPHHSTSGVSAATRKHLSTSGSTLGDSVGLSASKYGGTSTTATATAHHLLSSSHHGAHHGALLHHTSSGSSGHHGGSNHGTLNASSSSSNNNKVSTTSNNNNKVSTTSTNNNSSNSNSNNTNTSSHINMSHSQSTGDVSAIFGRA